MLRRLALVLALLAPTAVPAQVVIVPAAFGSPDCSDSTHNVTITWTSTFVFVAGDQYKVYLNDVSDSTTCPGTAAASGTLVDTEDVASQTLNFTTLTRSLFISQSGAACAPGAPDSIIYVCVQHVDAGGTNFRAVGTGSAPLNLKPPPIPVSVTAAAGDTALYVSWVDGLDNGVVAATYEVTAVTSPTPDVFPTRVQSFTGTANNKVTGLTNNQLYQVTVKALAAGSSPSVASLPAYGTPQPVQSFWDQYQADGGREQGGCGGGPAGLVSLLGVALGLRGLRRRS